MPASVLVHSGRGCWRHSDWLERGKIKKQGTVLLQEETIAIHRRKRCIGKRGESYKKKKPGWPSSWGARVEEIRWRSDLANVPAVTLKGSCRPSRAAQGHENTPLSHAHTHTLHALKICIMKTQTVCFSNWRGFAGAAGYVRETRASRCEVLFSVEELCLPDDAGSLRQGVDLSCCGAGKGQKAENWNEKNNRAERGHNKTRLSESQLQSAIVVQMVLCNCTSAS